MNNTNPLPRLSGHITDLHVDPFTLWIKLDKKSRAYVKKEFDNDHETGTIRLSSPEWARMLRYLSTGQSAVKFDLVDFIPGEAAPLKVEDVVGRDGDRLYWTVSGEVEICPDVN